MSVIRCAFCKGKGKDPFDLLSELAVCQVCSGRGTVEVIVPAVKCAFCKGTGVYPHNGRVTCTVCSGKGMVTAESDTDTCSECEGTGHTIDSGLPCIKCRGKGVVRKGG